jgi:N6-adenosine-specific RNA methylase IME4
VTTALSVVQRDPVLMRLSAARATLLKAKSMQAVKQIADFAKASKVYAQQQKLGQEAINFAYAVQVEAQRRLGQMWKGAPKNVGAQGSKVTGSKRVPVKDTTPTLKDAGLTKKEASASVLLANLPDDQFERVKERKATVARVRREIKAAAIRKTISAPEAKYRVIYADPPWSYGDKADAGSVQSGGAARHYPTMSITELCAVPVADWCEENAVLFLWVTSPLLFECAPVVKAWGFSYRASFVWDKVRHNMGHYNSVRHEFLLVCVRGSATPDVVELFDSVQVIERTGHSEKPAEFRRIIETLYPHGKRVELFARQQVDGWTAWGNEIPDDAAVASA